MTRIKNRRTLRLYRRWESATAKALVEEFGPELGEPSAALFLNVPLPPSRERLDLQMALLRSLEARARGVDADGAIALFREFMP
jgi:hypothetical protein